MAVDRFIPFAKPDIGPQEINAVVRTMESGWLTTGPCVREFEQQFAAYTGARHALAVSSCTSALHLALEAAGVSTGDLVVVPVFTFTATAEVVRYLGADPAFVDIQEDSLNIDCESVRMSLERCANIKAIVPVHFAGQPCGMNRLLQLKGEFSVALIEDAAHAFPAGFGGKIIGNIGDATAFSFYATKTLTTGEGGMLTTNNDGWAERMRTMRLHGISRDVFARYQSKAPAWYYEVVAPGYKYNMTDVAAAIGIEQLKRVEAMRARREEIAARYTAAFADLPLDLPYVSESCSLHAWHLYTVKLRLHELTINRDIFIEKLAAAGVGTSVHFIPLHMQPYWQDRYGLKPEDFPIATNVYQRILSLPLYSAMSDADVEYVIEQVRKVLIGHAR